MKRSPSFGSFGAFATFAALTMLAVTTATVHAREESGRKAFVSAWDDRAVILKQTLYSVAYDERDRVLPATRRRVSGLTVATPATMYFQFDARDSEEDLVGLDPDRLVSHFDAGSIGDIEAATLVVYERGMELVITDVEIERDIVRLSLRRSGSDDLATTLTVQWPTALSQELAESAMIDGVLARFFIKI